MRVVLDPETAAAIRRHALACLPAEACGLLARAPRTGMIELVGFAPIRNLAAAPDRFAMDPVAVARVEAAWRAAGLRIGGVFHSHPNGRAVPSAADIATAALWPEVVQVILAVDGDRQEVVACTGWRFAEGVVPLRFHPRETLPA